MSPVGVRVHELPERVADELPRVLVDVVVRQLHVLDGRRPLPAKENRFPSVCTGGRRRRRRVGRTRRGQVRRSHGRFRDWRSLLTEITYFFNYFYFLKDF